MRKIFFSSLLLVIFICGCSAQLRSLISLSGEQEAQQRYLDSQSNKFKLLLNDIKQDRLKSGVSSDRVVKLYGEPIAMKDIESQKVFLYREPKDFFPDQKVYLFFDEKDVLTGFELVNKEPLSNPPQ